MSHKFYADPKTQAALRTCQISLEFVPLVSGGQLQPVRELNIGDHPVALDLSAEDYVLGLEVLGCRFSRNEIDDVVVIFPPAFGSTAWEKCARSIHAVRSDHCEGRRMAVSDYLHDREREWLGITLLDVVPEPASLDALTLAFTVHEAFDNGRLCGLDPFIQAGQCPHLHEQLDLRRAWMDGFSAGRVSRAAGRG